MKPFTKTEAIIVSLLFLIVFGITSLGLKTSLRRSRDAGRKSDLGALSEALHAFYEDYGFFPPSDDGKIKMCKAENFDSVLARMKEEKRFDLGGLETALIPCEWGSDALADILDEAGLVYLERIPIDPRDGQGIKFLYLSNTRRFQIYAYLEGEVEEGGYDEKIVARNLPCGEKICSFGKSSGDTPLDKSFEKYEEELDRLRTGK